MQQLLKLARETLKSYFQKREPAIPNEIKQKYSKKQACFVTLTKNGELRGCVGSLSPHFELYKDIITNVINAAFHDPRFPPLSKHELEKIKIEISILTASEKLEFRDDKDLLKKIDKNMGLILEQGIYTSTFLPQVWGQIPSKEQFLEQLSLKAGLSPDAWKSSGIHFYRVEKIEEK